MLKNKTNFGWILSINGHSQTLVKQIGVIEFDDQMSVKDFQIIWHDDADNLVLKSLTEWLKTKKEKKLEIQRIDRERKQLEKRTMIVKPKTLILSELDHSSAESSTICLKLDVLEFSIE